MSTWSVRVELVPPGGAVSDEILDQLTDNLASHGGALAVEERGHLAVQLIVEARTRRAAIEHGERYVADALAAAGLSDAEVVEVHVLTWDEFEYRLAQPRIPELWGTSEAGEFLGVSNPRIDQLYIKHQESLPLVTKLAGTKGARIWLADTWRRFKESEHNPTRGRPRKEQAAKPSD